jgi:Arc/MetJ-type ribon-helix-helix transcriptional regulator
MSEESVERVDALVASGAFSTRAELVREAVDRLLSAEEQAAIDRAIIEGYTRMPQTEEELRWAEAAARRSVAAEPW